MEIVIYFFSLMLAAGLGFAVHRASLCTVRAVAEVLSSRRAYLLLSFAKTALWAMAVSIPILWLWPTQGMLAPAYAFTATVLVGSFLFGIGAALNGGCAFSTLGHLVDGELAMLATLVGFCTGIAGWVMATQMMAINPPQLLSLSMLEPGLATAMLGIGLWLWGGWELRHLWRSRTPGMSWSQWLFAPHYRLSMAAVILGISSGILYTLHGTWTYTTVLKQEVQGLFRPDVNPSWLLIGLFLAMVAGMSLSSWQRGGFRLQWRGDWLRRFCGGLLMGLGGALIPGGNDELILRAIPAFSPHALPAYIALLTGIACALWLLRLLRGKTINITCSGDICRSGEQ